MKKQYLMTGLAALVLAAATSCSRDNWKDDAENAAQKKSLINAEEQLGVAIDPNQDWNMVSTAKAVVVVNENYGEEYTVTVYENNPLVDNSGIVLTEGTVQSGDIFTSEFSYGKATEVVYIGLTDKYGYNYVQPINIVNGKAIAHFGDTATSRAPRRAGTPSSSGTYKNITAADVATYLDGAFELNEKNAANDYYDTAGNQHSEKKLKLNSDWNATIPALGLTNSKDQGNYARTLYIENGTWTVPSDQTQIGQGAVIVVGAKGHIVIPEGSHLLFTGDPENNCQLIVLPGGTVTGDGKLTFANGSLDGKYDYNGGTITVGTLNNNGGVVVNSGTLTANKLEGGAGKSIYVNNGKMNITTAAKGSSSANTRIYNNCYFTCTNELACRNIINGRGAYLYCGSLNMSGSNDGTDDDASIYLDGNSKLTVNGEAKFVNVNIVGSQGDNYALLELGSVGQVDYTGGWTGDNVTAGYLINNILLSIDNCNYPAKKLYEEVMNGGTASKDVLGNGNARLITKGAQNVVLKDADECAPAIEPGDKTDISKTKKTYTYAFEDTEMGDYDMNDIVLKVKENEDGTKLIIQLVAAGAQDKLFLFFNGQPLFDGKEVHDIFGVGQYTLVNTGNGAKTVKVPDAIEVSKPDNFAWETAPFSIKNKTKGNTVTIAGQGQDPHGICIPADWRWPLERIKITTSYTLFGRYASDATDTEAEKWYEQTPVNVY